MKKKRECGIELCLQKVVFVYMDKMLHTVIEKNTK